MDELALHFFPFPHVFRGERRDGALVQWPSVCSRCDRQCEKSSSRDLELCSYGLNYLRIDDDLLVAGVVVRDFPRSTPARQKRFQELRKDSITREDIRAAADRAQLATDQLEAQLRERMDRVVDEFRRSKAYQQEMVELLRPDLEQTLAQVHDYKQFVQQIVQNMNVLLESEFPGLPLEQKLERAKHEETAIYWAAVIMDEKLDAAQFLDKPERISEPREQGRTRLHGLVLKYVRIYKSRADRHGIKVAVVGDSRRRIEGNIRALGIIPHTLIDNALKYAPSGSQVVIAFSEEGEEVELAVESYGPKIEPEEYTRIFDLFYRGEAARRMSSEGTGFGLASAQNIAKAHDTEIAVRQDEERWRENTYLTTFSVRFKLADEAPKRPATARVKNKKH